MLILVAPKIYQILANLLSINFAITGDFFFIIVFPYILYNTADSQ